jgi:hypothetical protein
MNPTILEARAAVEDGGGSWVCIMDCSPHSTDLVLFNSKQTGSTLALKVTEITAEHVREHIKESNLKFGIGEK